MNQNTASTINTVIVGLGITGFACAEFLHSLGTPFTIIDSRDNPPKMTEFKGYYPNIAVFTGGFPPDILSKADRIILSPGVSKENPELTKYLSPHVEIISEIELFARMVSKPVVAITGSNGKSTVTSLVGEMAKAAGISVGVGGNLGTPALKLLMDMHDLYVLELSSFQLETTYSLKPEVATVLNLSLDHMDRYTRLEDYSAAKCRIFNGCKKIVVNRDDPILPKDDEACDIKLTKEKTQKQIPTISFGLDAPKDNNFGLIEKPGRSGEPSELYFARGTTALLPVSQFKLFGRHNIANALAALALGESIDLPMSAMLSTLENFSGLPHRSEWVREYQGVQWINDSKGTNVGATLSTLQGLAHNIPGKWVLIAGGLGKNADFTPLRSLIQQHCRAVVLIGEAADELENLLKTVVPCVRANSMIDAVQIATKEAKSGDGVLLSPACASYDMFRDFEDRGDCFKAAVSHLGSPAVGSDSNNQQ